MGMVDEIIAGLRAIVNRCDNGELGSSKVRDVRRLASDLLGKFEPLPTPTGDLT